MPCICEDLYFDNPEIRSKCIIYMLCCACKILTKEQMEAIDCTDNFLSEDDKKIIKWNSIYRNLREFYADHLFNDFVGNFFQLHEKNIANSEIERIGFLLNIKESNNCFYGKPGIEIYLIDKDKRNVIHSTAISNTQNL